MFYGLRSTVYEVRSLFYGWHVCSVSLNPVDANTCCLTYMDVDVRFAIQIDIKLYKGSEHLALPYIILLFTLIPIPWTHTPYSPYAKLHTPHVHRNYVYVAT
jgi:hypothetical protein